VSFDREQTKARLAALRQQGIYLGTSSWKYAGWQGLLYDRDRYVWRGRYAETRFERLCLAEFAEVFSAVSMDAAYYKFPESHTLEALAEQVPSHFRFGFKVTDEITLRRFPDLPRFGARAGQPNPHFLNAGLFVERFLTPCESIREHVGVIMFEFTRFSAADYARGRDFVADLDRFLGQLPRGWPYGVEIRNREFLRVEYFDVLARHGVAHVFNSWTDMPAVNEQLAMEGSLSGPDLVAARFLLRPGRSFEQAVKAFSPYNQIRDPYPEGRQALGDLIRKAMAKARRRALVFVNNRFEGCSLETIAAVLDDMDTANPG
jgi:uncharacterized protein YecE (DUF72 family)